MTNRTQYDQCSPAAWVMRPTWSVAAILELCLFYITPGVGFCCAACGACLAPDARVRANGWNYCMYGSCMFTMYWLGWLLVEIVIGLFVVIFMWFFSIGLVLFFLFRAVAAPISLPCVQNRISNWDGDYRSDRFADHHYGHDRAAVQEVIRRANQRHQYDHGYGYGANTGQGAQPSVVVAQPMFVQTVDYQPAPNSIEAFPSQGQYNQYPNQPAQQQQGTGAQPQPQIMQYTAET